MKKISMILALFLAILASSLNAQESFKDFQSYYQATLELNRDRFTDVNDINIGDAVLLPEKDGEGVSLLIAQKADCVYLLAKSAWNDTWETPHNGQLLRGPHWRLDTVPSESSARPMLLQTSLEPIVKKPTVDKSGWDWNNLWLLLFAFPFIWLVIREWRRSHPDRFPPQLGNMEFSRPEDIAARLVKTFPGKYSGRELKILRGKVFRKFGPWRILVKLSFKNGCHLSYIKSGETMVKVIIQSLGKPDIIEYWRAHCGNAIGAISRDQFELPDGWVFAPYTSDIFADVAKEGEKHNLAEEERQTFINQQKEIAKEVLKNLPSANRLVDFEDVEISFGLELSICAGELERRPIISSITSTRYYKGAPPKKRKPKTKA